MKNLEQTIPSMEVALMVGKEHHKLLRDIRGYVDQLNQSKVGCVEFFKEDRYVDSKGEERPCFGLTKKGCEFVSHKLIGIKGTEFTAKYINRFHDMEDGIKSGTYSVPKAEKPPALSSVNMVVRNITKTYKEAGVDPRFIAIAVSNIYKDMAGIDLALPIQTEETKLYDLTEIEESWVYYPLQENLIARL